MKLTLLKNHKGLIHGSDDKRIECDVEGVLKISTAEIHITPSAEAVVPVLLNGCTGIYAATFTNKYGEVFDLGKVTVRGGRIAPPTQSAVDFMELRCRCEALEDRLEKAEEDIRRLSNIFDTNSLNFIIK